MPDNVTPSLREQLLAREKQWQAAEADLAREAARMTPEEKVRAVSQLYELAVRMGWKERLAEGEEEIWMRWQRLREALLERSRSG